MKARSTTFLLPAVALAIGATMATPAAAFWQFFERPPGIERKPSPRYATKQQCESALKITEEKMKKAYPDRYPLVGSCEEYR
jgi:hypothetical protein